MYAEGELRNNLDDSEKVRELQDKVAELKAEVCEIKKIHLVHCINKSSISEYCSKGWTMFYGTKYMYIFHVI